MEKKKLKLSISGSSKKTISSIEQAKTQSKNSVLIEKKSGKYSGKSNYSKPFKQNDKNKIKQSFPPRKPIFSKPPTTTSDFEKRKLAEQRATRRLKGEEFHKESKGKPGFRKRELKLTVSRALSEEDGDTRTRSLASLRRAKPFLLMSSEPD